MDPKAVCEALLVCANDSTTEGLLEQRGGIDASGMVNPGAFTTSVILALQSILSGSEGSMLTDPVCRRRLAHVFTSAARIWAKETAGAGDNALQQAGAGEGGTPTGGAATGDGDQDAGVRVALSAVFMTLLGDTWSEVRRVTIEGAASLLYSPLPASLSDHLLGLWLAALTAPDPSQLPSWRSCEGLLRAVASVAKALSTGLGRGTAPGPAPPAGAGPETGPGTGSSEAAGSSGGSSGGGAVLRSPDLGMRLLGVATHPQQSVRDSAVRAFTAIHSYQDKSGASGGSGAQATDSTALAKEILRRLAEGSLGLEPWVSEGLMNVLLLQVRDDREEREGGGRNKEGHAPRRGGAVPCPLSCLPARPCGCSCCFLPFVEGRVEHPSHHLTMSLLLCGPRLPKGVNSSASSPSQSLVGLRVSIRIRISISINIRTRTRFSDFTATT